MKILKIMSTKMYKFTWVNNRKSLNTLTILILQSPENCKQFILFKQLNSLIISCLWWCISWDENETVHYVIFVLIEKLFILSLRYIVIYTFAILYWIFRHNIKSDHKFGAIINIHFTTFYFTFKFILTHLFFWIDVSYV